MIVFATSCVQPEPIESCLIGKTYKFLNGLWHGLILPISFIGSLFNEDIVVYAVNNNGGWYDFGFLLGLGGLTGSTQV